MNCFPCFNRNKDSDGSTSKQEQPPADTPAAVPESSSVRNFNFRELAMATKNFRQECVLGEGAFGRVFKGTLQASGQVVAVKQLDRNGMQGNKEFSAEVMTLSLLRHQNLVNLIGYCADGDQRVLVYEYMPLRSLEDHLFGEGPEKKPLDWGIRMKIASGAAKGLEYLHEQVNPSVIYGDFKPSNVLLNEEFEPKLSDVGLSKLGADGMNQPSSRVMDTFGYSAPEYSSAGEVTLKSDVYCFGIVLLELITGRRAIDTTRPTDEQNLVTWAQTFFRDPKRFPEMADPRLNNQFPATALNQAVGIAAMCLQDEPMVRPLINDVTSVLSCISMIPNDQPQALAPPQQQMQYENEVQQNIPSDQDKSSTESHSSSSSDSEDSEGESVENTHSSKDSDGESESGSDEESDDLSDEESTCNSDETSSVSENVKAKTDVNTSSRKSKRVSSRTSSQRKQGTSRQTVVTFRVPSLNSRYSGSGNSDTKEESSRSSSSEDSSSESEHNQQNNSREIGSSSSHPKRPKQRGTTSESVPQLDNVGHFNRSNTEPAQLKNLEILHS